MTRLVRKRHVLVFTALCVIVAGVWLAVGGRPTNDLIDQTATTSLVQFTDVTARAGIRFRHFSGASGKKLLPETMGGGVAVLDYDGDGWPDLFFVNSCNWPGHPIPANGPPTQALYRNKGDGTFEEVTAAAGLAIKLYGMGVAVGDYDNDGYPDLFISAVGGDRLFRNVPAPNGGRRFEDVTALAGLAGHVNWPNVSAEEFLRWADPIPFPASAAWLDFDGDGWLDLFVLRYLTWSPAIDLGIQAVLPGGIRAYVPPTQFDGAHAVLYRNRGDGTFEDISSTAGVEIAVPGKPEVPVGKALGVIVCDPDDDGWPDIIVANDTVRNFFFHNVSTPNGGRKFEEIGLLSNVAYADGRPRGGMGIDAGHIHPGMFAVVIANFSNEPNTLFRLVRPAPPMFADVALAIGLAGPTRAPMKFGAFFFDYDLDGRLDLLTCNGHLEPDIAAAQPGQSYPQPAQLFRNTGEYERLFVPVSAAEVGEDLFQPIVGRGCAYLDFDGDGDLDVILIENDGPARLLRNDNATKNHWVRLVLAAGDRAMNRDCLGAEITLEAGGVVQRRYVTATHGYLSQSELVVTFGLGTADVVDRVTVRWPRPDGSTQEWRGLRSGVTYRLTAGVPQAEPVAREPQRLSPQGNATTFFRSRRSAPT
jgi:hypothetical protein